MSKQRNVAILIFNDVEVLDFCGPFEVFAVTGRKSTPVPFNVYTVAENPGPVLTWNQMSVNPKYSLRDCPPPDVLVVPGGRGTRSEMTRPALTDWIRDASANAEVVLSVCTGALLLAKAGLLDGLLATTHHAAMDELRSVIAPSTTLCPDKRFVDNGRFVLSGGISAGIDAAFYVVARLLGNDTALETAEHMEYDIKPESLLAGGTGKGAFKYVGVGSALHDQLKGTGSA